MSPWDLVHAAVVGLAVLTALGIAAGLGVYALYALEERGLVKDCDCHECGGDW